jgi:hypothetical protein
LDYDWKGYGDSMPIAMIITYLGIGVLSPYLSAFNPQQFAIGYMQRQSLNENPVTTKTR